MKKIALGMMAIALTFSAMAQTTDNSADKNNPQQKEAPHRHFKGGQNFDKLNLTDDQKGQMKTLNENFKQQMKDLHNQGNLSADEQKQKREALVKDHKEKVAAILTPEQNEQLKAFKKEHKSGKDRSEKFSRLTKELNLTPDQTTKMSAINATFKTNLQSIKRNTSLSSDQKKEQMKSLMKQHRSDVEALLTEDQKAQMKSHLKNRPNRTAVK